MSFDDFKSKGESAMDEMHYVDWSCLKTMCTKYDPKWSEEYTETVLTEYKRFLAMKVAVNDCDDTKVYAPPDIDIMWQKHILLVGQYLKDCSVIRGPGNFHGTFKECNGTFEERHLFRRNPDMEKKDSIANIVDDTKMLLFVIFRDKEIEANNQKVWNFDTTQKKSFIQLLWW